MKRQEKEIVYNFCHEQSYTIEDICAAFSAVAGYRDRKLVVPLPVVKFIGLMFECLSALGIKSPINRDRIMKLNRSTNIEPVHLRQFDYKYFYSLRDALEEWQAMSGNREFR